MARTSTLATGCTSRRLGSVGDLIESAEVSLIGFCRVSLWGAVLICLPAIAGCKNRTDSETKPVKSASTTESKSKVEIEPVATPQSVDLTKAVIATDAPDLPAGATLLDPDMVWDMSEPDSFAISPDGQSIVYISRGALRICSVAAGPATKLAALPNTATEYLSTPHYRKQRTNFNKHDSMISSATYFNHRNRKLESVVELKWSFSQDGVFYTLGSIQQARPWTRTYRVMHASNEGMLTPVTTISRTSYDQPHDFWRFDVRRDRKMVVASGYTPLIWNASTGKPQATCFDYLLPATKSGRFIGIEIDTRQLVVTDENLNIESRLDVTFNPRQFCQMIWSQDERFAICANRLEDAHENKNRWVGFRINLETGEQRPLEDGRFSTRNSSEEYIADQFVFTGQGGEVVRASSTGRGFFDGINNYLTTIPAGDGPVVDLYRFQKRPWPREKYRTRKPYPAVRFSKDGLLIAIALPREGQKLGYRYWIMDRNGNRWSCGPDDPSLFVSPYHVIALADNGRQVIACDGVQLFSVPVAKLQSTKEPENK